MRILTCLFCCAFLFACHQTQTDEEPDHFQAFLSSIPELELPFMADNLFSPGSSLSLDTAFNDYNDVNANWVYAKTKINDSVYAVIFLLAGDDVYPELITYDARGRKLSELVMTHTPGGSTGYDENGSSYVIMQKDFSIVITDTVYHFQRDSLHEIIDSTRTMEVIEERYQVNPDGKINRRFSPR